MQVLPRCMHSERALEAAGDIPLLSLPVLKLEELHQQHLPYSTSSTLFSPLPLPPALHASPLLGGGRRSPQHVPLSLKPRDSCSSSSCSPADRKPESSSSSCLIHLVASTDIPNLRVPSSIYSFDVEAADRAYGCGEEGDVQENVDAEQWAAGADDDAADATRGGSSPIPRWRGQGDESLPSPASSHGTLEEGKRQSFAIEKLDELIRHLYAEEGVLLEGLVEAESTPDRMPTVAGSPPPQGILSLVVRDDDDTPVIPAVPEGRGVIESLALPEGPPEATATPSPVSCHSKASLEGDPVNALYPIQVLLEDSGLSDAERQATMQRLVEVQSLHSRGPKRPLFKRLLRRVKRSFKWKCRGKDAKDILAPMEALPVSRSVLSEGEVATSPPEPAVMSRA